MREKASDVEGPSARTPGSAPSRDALASDHQRQPFVDRCCEGHCTRQARRLPRSPRNAIGEEHGPVLERLDRDALELRTGSIRQQVVGDERRAGARTAREPGADEQVDLVDEPGAEERPVQPSARVDADPAHAVLCDKAPERAGEVDPFAPALQDVDIPRGKIVPVR